MIKFKIRKGDTVKILSGKDRGKTGKVIRMMPNAFRVVVENINVRTKFEKGKRPGQAGQKISFAAPLHISNVMLIDSNSGQSSRVGYAILDNGTKQRIARKSGKAT